MMHEKRRKIYVLIIEEIPWEAIIGVFGTCLGTIIGWCLGRAGKINPLFPNVAITFLPEPGEQYNLDVPMWKQSPQEIVVEVDTLIHNSKGIPVSLLNCDILLEYQDEKVKLSQNYGLSTEGDFNEFDKFINIGAFSIIEAKCKIHRILPHPEKLKTGYSLYFVYELDGKKQIKRKIRQQAP